MNPYLICATPRSGSAWLANFLSSGDCLCVHEPLAHSPRAEGYRVVGGVDTGAAFHVEQLRAAMPALRLYALTREPAEIRASLERCGLPWLDYPALALPTFDYAQLRDVDYLGDVWGELNGAGFDATRAAQLIEMNVQRDLGRLAARLQERYEWHGQSSLHP
ncbi:MAG TPA: hypothetical protein PKC95_00180 [Thauera aminoaromatica]|nr:hypothetical protein [Thauera aminoaromatica]